jgi:thymidine phosphorylase
VVGLGGGRTRPQDPIDFAVGLTDLVELGAKVEAGQPLAFVHARTDEAAEKAVREVQQAYRVSADKAVAEPMIYRTIRP